MLVEAVALDMGAEKGERRIYGGELENFSWLSYHVEVTQDEALNQIYLKGYQIIFP